MAIGRPQPGPPTRRWPRRPAATGSPALPDHRRRLRADRRVRGDRRQVAVFLWKGQLVQKVSEDDQGTAPRHRVERARPALARLVPDGYSLRAGSAGRARPTSVPEPDLNVVRGSSRDYETDAPSPATSPSSSRCPIRAWRMTRGEMLRSLRRAMIPVYWVVNIPDRRIDVYTGPTRPGRPVAGLRASSGATAPATSPRRPRRPRGRPDRRRVTSSPETDDRRPRSFGLRGASGIQFAVRDRGVPRRATKPDRLRPAPASRSSLFVLCSYGETGPPWSRARRAAPAGGPVS